MNPLIWGTVSLVSPNHVIRFLRSTVYTVARHNQSHLLSHLSNINSSKLTDVSSLPKVDLSAINANPLPALVDALNGNLLDLQQHWQQQQQQQQQLNPNNANGNDNNDNAMDVENPMEGLTHYVNSLVHIALTNTQISSDSNGPSSVTARQAISGLTSLNSQSLEMEIDDGNRNGTGFGSAEFVKRLSIPSFDCRVNLLGLLNDLLPNLQSIHFQHIHTEETTGTPFTAIFTPVSQTLLQTFQPIINRVIKLAIEDVYPTSWPHILKLLGGGPNLLALDPPSNQQQAPPSKLPPQKLLNLRSLNLEAVATTDSFDSAIKLSHIFPSVPNLEAARFDGIAIGPDTSILTLARCCKHLKVIALDYCPSVTMKSFEILWNEVEGLQFLGLAGIVNDQQNPNDHFHMHHHHHHNQPPHATTQQQHTQSTQIHRAIELRKHPVLRIVRFVDCDVSDQLFYEISQNGVALEMLRFVFEDDECEGIVGVVERLSERALMPFAQDYATTDNIGSTGVGGESRRGLKKLAFTWCPGFTVDCLTRVLQYGWGNCYAQGVEVLDLHKDVQCRLGVIPEEVLEEAAVYMTKVKVLNLYGQTSLKNETLAAVFTPQNFQSLTSLCLNESKVTPQVLRHIILGLSKLTAISLMQCENITLADLKQLFEECPVEMKRIKRLYTEHCWNAHNNGGGDGGGNSASSSVPEDDVDEEDEEQEDFSMSPLIPATELQPRQQSNQQAAAAAAAATDHGDWGGIHEMMDVEEEDRFERYQTPPPPQYSSASPRPMPRLAVQENREPSCIIHEDLWFVDEGLDIMSLINGSVRRATDIRV
ncbi:hypothetical protein BDR26DRAFT_855815 [Obelidium mucronatum]|nr:hypothetical protein BDR26DRAFT_855815 [Obelidium mucronatum]